MANASIDLAAAHERGIVVCGTASLPSPTAELAWGLILALLRHIPAEDRGMREGGWQHTIGPELAGRRSRCSASGGSAAGWPRSAGRSRCRCSRGARTSAPSTAAAGAAAVTRTSCSRAPDVLSIHRGSATARAGWSARPSWRGCRPGAVLINTSRGPIVDEAALLAALADGTLAGAGLDVYDEEPLPPDHPLRHAPNTVLTPHLGYVTTGTYAVFFRDAVEDVAAYLRGDPLRVLGR